MDRSNTGVAGFRGGRCRLGMMSVVRNIGYVTNKKVRELGGTKHLEITI